MMKEMKCQWAALGAFLLVLGATLIMAIPALFFQSGLGSIAGSYIAYAPAPCVTITSIEGVILAYVLASGLSNKS